MLLCPEDSELEKYAADRPFALRTFKKTFSVNPFTAYKIFKIGRAEKIDLIHVHDSHAHGFAWLAALLFGSKIPIVVSRRLAFPLKKSFTTRLKYNAACVKKIICVSKVVQQAVAVTVKDEDKIIIIPDGIDNQRFKQVKSGKLHVIFDIPFDKILIGNTAALTVNKDWMTFLKTAGILIAGGVNAHFFIIGRDEETESELKQYTSENNLQKHVTFTGFRKDIAQILPELDVFLFTSKQEGFGSSVLDAMAAGVPVVTTQAGGITDFLEEEKNGLSAPVGAASLLAQKIQRLLDEHRLRDRIRKGGKTTAAKFTKEETARKTLAVYRGILGLG